MVGRFEIKTVVEHGQPHAVIFDFETGEEIHCDLNEINVTIWGILGVL